MSETKASPYDIAYMKGFSDAYATVGYLTVRLYVAYGIIIGMGFIILALLVRRSSYAHVG